MKASARQQGAALLVVLSLVAIASVVAMAGVKSALVDERLAGNMRAMAQAQMAADWGAAELLRGADQADSVERAACELLEKKVLAGNWDGDWRNGGTIPGQPHIGYRWAPCDYTSNAAMLVVGVVDGGEHNLAMHGVIVAAVGDDGGIDGLPVLPDDCDTVSSALPTSNENTYTEDINMCFEEPGAPYVPGNPGPKVDEIEEEVLSDGATLDASGCLEQGGTLFCDGDQGFSQHLDLSQYPDVDLVVVDGPLTLNAPEGDYKCDILASGQIAIVAGGQVTLTGDMWGAGITVTGDQQMTVDGLVRPTVLVQGALVSHGSIVLNFNVMVEPKDGSTNDDAILWLDRSA